MAPVVEKLPEVGEKPLAERSAIKPRVGPKRVHGARPAKSASDEPAGSDIRIQPIVFYLSLTGSTEASAKKIFDRLQKKTETQSEAKLLPPQLHDICLVDFEDYFVKTPETGADVQSFYLILVPTYNIDTELNPFLSSLDETHNDFRVNSAPLASLSGYSVFGFGDKEGWPTEEDGFCSQAKEIDRWMAKLTGRKRAFPLGMGDIKSNAQEALDDWYCGTRDVIVDLAANRGLGEGVPGSGDPAESDEEDEDEKQSQVVDLEDLNKQLPTKKPVAAKEMVPKESPTYKALTKQGYTIVGSHSGVKICRWTKSALRGRGSCYKNSFYGIKSHLCMETTPSLSCSNKCVFCWRHGTNPVGTTWRWQVDPPDLIFQGAKEGHYKKIKMMRGVAGVRAERFAEAMRIRHCALSLVGEPIFYPHINQFLHLLHSEHISSFLVCNAQHPDQLAALDRVTQLYVSIDASNRESLRKIDRPLHRDFWERFNRCLDILREKRHFHRTVYRLTLVKGFNMADEVMGYANLISQGLPCFVEIKGVTYCGTSTSAGAGLTMQNVPFYSEIVDFVTALDAELARRGLDYGLAAEHAHSCCVLLASKRFYRNNKWHTRINYDRFFELLEAEQRDGVGFTPEDYMRETEEWALWGNGGFDPADERHYRKKKGQGNKELEQPDKKKLESSCVKKEPEKENVVETEDHRENEVCLN